MKKQNNFLFREARILDFPEILPIIEDAKVFLRQNGVDQWQDGFPSLATIRRLQLLLSCAASARRQPAHAPHSI